MKSFNLFKTIFLLLVILMLFGYKPLSENENTPKPLIGNLDGVTTSTYTNKVFVLYAVGATDDQKNGARQCFISKLNGVLLSVVGCANDSNAETLVFANIGFRTTTSIVLETDDDEEKPDYRIISEEELMNATNCKTIMAASVNMDCSGSGGFMTPSGF